MSVGPRVAVGDLDVERIGNGPAVILVHGSIVGAAQAWRKQRPLADCWTLVMPNRPGFAGSPPLDHGDFEIEADLIAELLADGAHLIGHSYGAVIALLAAAARPSRVHSLIVSEPGLLRLAAGEATADAMIDHGEQLYRSAAELAPADFLRMFRTGVHSTHHTPDSLPGELERGVRHAARERPPWHADVPFAQIASALFPKLVISGDHSPVFESVCDRVAAQIGGERAIVGGRAHTIPATGEAYNRLVHDFLMRARGRDSG